MAFEQAASSMNFFADERTDRMLCGLRRSRRPWFQSINPLVLVMVGAAVRSAVDGGWRGAGASRARRPKMAGALALMAIGYVFMVFARPARATARW